nr:MAG TPA: hypothetical protein [Caudoviricetes sp.]
MGRSLKDRRPLKRKFLRNSQGGIPCKGCVLRPGTSKNAIAPCFLIGLTPHRAWCFCVIVPI